MTATQGLGLDRRADPGDRAVVSVVVVSYNTKDWIVRCLDSLAASTSHELDVIVVDNASRDGSADAVAAALPGATVIRNEWNLGFARAVNQGAEAAKGGWARAATTSRARTRPAAAVSGTSSGPSGAKRASSLACASATGRRPITGPRSGRTCRLP